jgi:hypothetical protein
MKVWATSAIRTGFGRGNDTHQYYCLDVIRDNTTAANRMDPCGATPLSSRIHSYNGFVVDVCRPRTRWREAMSHHRARQAAGDKKRIPLSGNERRRSVGGQGRCGCMRGTLLANTPQGIREYGYHGVSAVLATPPSRPRPRCCCPQGIQLPTFGLGGESPEP